MKSLTLILSLLLITYSLSKEVVYGLTDCKVENDATTKTTAVITCTAKATLTGTTFKDDYLFINTRECKCRCKCNKNSKISNMYKRMYRLRNIYMHNYLYKSNWSRSWWLVYSFSNCCCCW